MRDIQKYRKYRKSKQKPRDCLKANQFTIQWDNPFRYINFGPDHGGN